MIIIKHDLLSSMIIIKHDLLSSMIIFKPLKRNSNKNRDREGKTTPGLDISQFSILCSQFSVQFSF
jgi:hypothetical protein